MPAPGHLSQSLTSIAALIDATVIGSASKGDQVAAWAIGSPEPAMLEAHNRPLKPLRSRIEKISGTGMRSDNFRRVRWMGLDVY